MENKEPKSGAPSAASNNGSTLSSGNQQPAAAPTWVGEKEKIRYAISSLSASALGLSDRIMYECECMTPATAERAMDEIHDMALLQANVKTVIGFLEALLDNDALEILDKYDWSAEYDRKTIEDATRQLIAAEMELEKVKEQNKKIAACYQHLFTLVSNGHALSEEAAKQHRDYKRDLNCFPQL